MIWIGIAAVPSMIIAMFFLYRRIRRRQTRLISLVALLREPISLDPGVLARVAGKAWNVDLGDESSPDDDGFVAGIGISNVIMRGDRGYMINSFPQPYCDNPDEAAEHIPDLRIRQHFVDHKAWFSCDAMGVDGNTTDEEVNAYYCDLGKLLCEFLDENCLLVYLPDSGTVLPVNEETEAALRSSDPLRELQKSMTVPIIEVPDDDPAMVKAVQNAKREWPKFVAAFEARSGEGHAVKAPLVFNDTTEYIWITVKAIEGGRIYGELANDPHDLGSLKLGSKVTVNVEDLNDWTYIDEKDNLVGGFTIQAIGKAARRK